MLSLAAILTLACLGIHSPQPTPATTPPVAGAILRYDRPVGQVARYHVALDVRGAEVSLDERIPVRWKAQFDLSEEVIAREPDGSFWLRVVSSPMVSTDGNGVFANDAAMRWPVVRLHISQRGELLEPVQPETNDQSRAVERALASLITEAGPVTFPENPVLPRSRWTSQCAEATQTNRLVALKGAPGREVARISSMTASPLALEEEIAELGLVTSLTGQSRQTSEIEFLTASGLVRRQSGSARITTQSQVTLALPGGQQLFTLQSDLTMAFNLRLVAINGQPVSAD